MMVSVGWAQVADVHELSSEQIRADLASGFPYPIAEFEITGDWNFTHWKANEVTQPTDNAERPFTVRTVAAADGSSFVIRGLAIYGCPPGTTGPWRYDRWFQFEKRLHGVERPSNEVLRERALLAAIQPRGLLGSPTPYLHFYEFTIPEDPQFEQESVENIQFLIHVVMDIRKGSSEIAKVRRVLRCELRLRDGLGWSGRGKKIEEEVLETRRVDRNELAGMPSLKTTTLDKICADELPASVLEKILEEKASGGRSSRGRRRR